MVKVKLKELGSYMDANISIVKGEEQDVSDKVADELEATGYFIVERPAKKTTKKE